MTLVKIVAIGPACEALATVSRDDSHKTFSVWAGLA